MTANEIRDTIIELKVRKQDLTNELVSVENQIRELSRLRYHIINNLTAGDWVISTIDSKPHFDCPAKVLWFDENGSLWVDLYNDKGEIKQAECRIHSNWRKPTRIELMCLKVVE